GGGGGPRRARPPARAGPRHDRRAARRAEAVLEMPHLLERLLGDRQRLDQHGDVAQGPRHDVQVAGVLHDLLAEEAVSALDAMLDEVAGVAEVLPAATARR